MKSYDLIGSTKIETLQIGTSSFKRVTLYTPVTVGFQRILLFFKIIGRYPNATDQNWENGTCYTKYNMGINKHTIAFYIFGLFSGAFILLAEFQWGSLGFQLFPPGYLWPDRRAYLSKRPEEYGTFGAGIFASLECIYGLLAVVEYIPAWLKRKRFQDWLNNWNSIEKEMLSLHGYSGELFDSKFANLFTTIYICVPTCLFGTLILHPVIERQFMFTNFTFAYLCYGSTILILSEDVRAVLILKTVRDAYMKVRISMENMQKWKLFRPNLSKNIDKWNAILIGIRNQAKLGSDCVAFQQLLAILLLIYFSSASIFLCFEEFSGSTKKSVVQIVGTFTLMNFCRIYCKISYAYQTATEESNVVAAAKQLELGDEIVSQEDKLKIMRLHDMLLSNPVQFSLGGYATMNKSLLVAILSQVVTQSIVFMQFQQSSRG